MQDSLTADQDYKLWVLVNQAKDAVYRAREKELGKVGVTIMSAAVLFAVRAMGKPATPAEISRWLFREPHSVSGLLNRMEKEGLIKKTKDLERKNLVRVTLTEKGQQAYDLSMKRDSIHRVMSSLSKEQREQLTSCLNTVLDSALRELGVEQKLPFP